MSIFQLTTGALADVHYLLTTGALTDVYCLLTSGAQCSVLCQPGSRVLFYRAAHT